MKKTFLLFSLLFIFVLPLKVLALTISPPVTELEVEPGEKIDFSVKVFNELDYDLYLSSNLASFEAEGEKGEAKILFEKKEDFLNWFEISEPSIVLSPLQKKVIPVTVDVPPQATPGGYYVVILWQVAPSATETSGVGISSQVGHLILLKVKGELKEEGRILDFNIKKVKKLLNPLPVVFTLRFQNLGNIHLKPQGQIIIKNKFGFKIKTLPINPAGSNVLPQSTREFKAIWFNPWDRLSELKSGQFSLVEFFSSVCQPFAFGNYTAELELTYGTKPEIVQAQKSFYLFSGYFIILVIFILLLVIILLILIAGKKKRNKK